MIWFFGAIAAVAGGYQLFAILAIARHLASRELSSGFHPPVSILKPVRGLDPGFAAAIRSHAEQAYAEFEILFGVEDPRDPAVEEIEGLRRDFPAISIRLITGAEPAANRKVGVLMRLQREARFPVLLVSDSDILVPDGYLRRVVEPLGDSRVGLVTCLYRAEAETLASRWEALGIATDFTPSALVAPLVGVSEFGLGSTLAFRCEDLEAIGGFRAVGGYIADDYQIGCRIHALGRRNVISKVVVATRMHGGGSASSWKAVWEHQLRWARTVRVSRPGGYAGLPVTHASFWALVLALCGQFWLAAIVLALRFAMAIASGWFVLRATDVLKLWFLVPFRDLWGTAVWACGLFGSRVKWGGLTLKLTRDGRIVKDPKPLPD